MEVAPAQLENPTDGVVAADAPRPRNAPSGVALRGRGRGRGRYNFYLRRRELAYLTNFRLMCHLIQSGYGRPSGRNRGQVALSILIDNWPFERNRDDINVS